MDIKELLPILNDREKYNLVEMKFDNGGGFNCFNIEYEDNGEFKLSEFNNSLLLFENRFREIARFSMDLRIKPFIFYDFIDDEGWIEYAIPLKVDRDAIDRVVVKLIVRLEKR